MASFENPVAVPRTSDYAPKPVDFSILGNLYNTYQQQQLANQQRTENDLIIQRQRAALEQEQKMRSLFPGGLPIDKVTGNVDVQRMLQTMVKAGDYDAYSRLYPAIQGQEAGRPSPLLSGGAAPAGPGGAPAATPPPARTGDLPPTSRSPQGDQPGSVMGVVAEKVGDADAGRIANSIAAKIGVDPNAGLTLGQKKRAMVLLDRELAASAPAAAETAPQATPGPLTGPPPAAAAPLSPAARVADAFGAVTPPAPPSAGGVTPAVAPAPVAPAAPPGAPAAPAAAAPVAPAAVAAAPAPPAPPQRITPTVPLPKGFTDPQQAILALRAEAARVGANPRAAPAMKALNDWADRIEGSLAPITVQPGQRIVSPTGQTLYASPERPVSVGGNLVRPDTGEVVYSSASPLTGNALDSAAWNFLTTGKMPPNIGRGVQGAATSNKIMERAAEMEEAGGLNYADRPTRWRNYATSFAGARVLEQRTANLTLVEQETKTLIPRVRELINTVSRTKYPDLNRIIIAGKTKTGDENEIKLGVAIGSLVPVYARLLKPTGQIGVTDTQNAQHILEQKWASGQMRAALDQMEVERKAAADALVEARKEFANTAPDWPALERARKKLGIDIKPAGGQASVDTEGSDVSKGGEKPPDAMVGGKPAWRINGKWFDNPEGK